MIAMPKQNEYTRAIGMKAFDETPKAVFAAIAISFVMLRGDENGDELPANAAWNYIRREWKALYDNGIVFQKPPKK